MMKKLLCSLLCLCLAVCLAGASLAEGAPWVNPELPGNLPAERPGAETDFYLSVNYDRHRQASWTDAYNDDSSRETLLAGIGQTIGHELSHGYDPNGIQFGWDGASENVLSEEDQPKFQERVQRLVDALNRIELADGVHVNGEHVIYEAAADLLGLRLTLDLAGKTEGFEYDLYCREYGQRYYRSFPTREAALQDYASNLHPAAYVRINFTTAQQDELYATYPAIVEGTPMYVAPENRVSIW